MKKLTTISIFVFWAIVTALLVTGLVFYDRNKVSPIASSGLGTTTANGSSSIVLNTAEIAKHQLASDCWLIVSNKVYNVTSYISAHPGGAQAITSFCGKEATTAFATKGGQGSHSSTANNLLAVYYIGDLNASANAAVIQKASTLTPPQSKEREDEWEDDD